MPKPHETIRQDALKTIKNDTARSIMSSQFTATPLFEDGYYDYLRNNPKYLAIYKRWVLSQNPLLLPDDNDLYQLRQGTLGLPDVISPGIKMNISKPLLLLLLDILNSFLDNLIARAMAYYNIPNDQDKIFKAKVSALQEALILWDKENVDREGYPNFSIAIGETFKAFFADNIGMTEISFPADDVSFKEAFEKEWKRIAVYTDHLYGFEVIPVFSPEDTFKYLRLPFTNKSLRSLSRQKNYREVMNYISAIATFKPMPDRRIKAYYRQKLCKLFTPLVTAKIKKVIKKKQFALDPQDLQQPLEENLAKLAGQFEFFYSTRKNLENKHQVPAGSLIFPLQNQLVKLGSVSADDQYPFTAYITRQFEKKMRTFFSGDLPSEAAISLDEVIKIDFEEYKPRSELVTNASMEESIYLPDYDAENADGQKLGWKIKTFAGIVKKSVDTLRRWDRLGLIDPIRYEIYSSLQRKKLKYRAYTKNHIEQTRKISEEMRKRQHHQA